jgi:hypothetical protein
MRGTGNPTAANLPLKLAKLQTFCCCTNVPSPGSDDGKCLLLLKQIASFCYFTPATSAVQANLLMTEFS